MLADKIRKDKARARLKSISKRVYFGVASAAYLAILLSSSLSVFAQEQTGAIDPALQGPQEPTGPDNTSYTYNEETGLWENDYYTWNPVTKQTAPKSETNYSYNPETDKWDGEYVYSPEQKKYIKPPQNTAEQPAIQEAPDDDDIAPTLANQAESGSQQKATPLGSDNSINKANQTSGAFDLFFNANISVNIGANSKSGDASVLQNTNGGSALSGDAYSEAYIMNIIQSMLGSNGTLPELHTTNIQGDYFGDIKIDPNTIAGDVSVQENNSADLEVRVGNNVNLENNIDLTSQSGDALVSGNTNAGDATSGDATAIANIVNMINSAIAANESYFGVLNVNGDLDGDVLFSDNLTEQLLAANVPTSTISMNDTNIDAELNNNVTITDNINLSATSGQAEVSSNTNAGDATSGDAKTDITVFNLIGHNVQADKALIVFVNVGGQWNGFITNAPAGSTAAALGTGVTSSSNNSLSADFEIDNNINITNNVNVHSQSGDASVIGNTNAGNATSGDATSSASVANIVNSSFNLNNYLHWLFIRVSGDWCGSVNTDTECGNAPIIPPAIATRTNSANSDTTNSTPPLPDSFNPANIRIFSADVASAPPEDNEEVAPIVLSAIEDITPQDVAESDFAAPALDASNSTASWIFVGGVILGYIVVFQGGRIIDMFRR